MRENGFEWSLKICATFLTLLRPEASIWVHPSQLPLYDQLHRLVSFKSKTQVGLTPKELAQFETLLQHIHTHAQKVQ
jgi:hypothetical protein